MEYRQFTEIPNQETIEELVELHETIFGSSEGLIEELVTKHNPHILTVYENEKMIGYKIGYERKRGAFYSWLGGVHHEKRKGGLGQEMIVRQHQWCRENGYKTIRTHTMNKWRNMLILNLKDGFDVIGTFTDGNGETKIILEKVL